MLYVDITAMAMLYPEACRHLHLGSEILKIRASKKILPLLVVDHHPPRSCGSRKASFLCVWRPQKNLHGVEGVGEACMAFTCAGFRLQPLCWEPQLKPTLCLLLSLWSALWWRRKGPQPALFSTFPPLTGEWKALPWVSVVQTGEGNSISHELFTAMLLRGGIQANDSSYSNNVNDL